MNDNVDSHGNPIPGVDVDGRPTGNVGNGNVGDGNVGDGNVGAGNVGVGTSAPPPAPEPEPSGPIVSDDRDEADYGSNPH